MASLPYKIYRTVQKLLLGETYRQIGDLISLLSIFGKQAKK
jgi:hypothetical protein